MSLACSMPRGERLAPGAVTGREVSNSFSHVDVSVAQQDNLAALP